VPGGAKEWRLMCGFTTLHRVATLHRERVVLHCVASHHTNHTVEHDHFLKSQLALRN